MAPKKRERSKAGRKPDCARCLYEAAQPVKRRRRTVLQSRRAFELALLGDPLVRLGRALDAILLFIAFGREQPDHLIYAVAIAAAEQTGDDVNIVADTKLMRQENLRTITTALRHPGGA